MACAVFVIVRRTCPLREAGIVGRRRLDPTQPVYVAWLLVSKKRQQPPEWGGESPEPHGEIITLRNGRVSEMVVYPTVQAALEAASH